ncbi:MAG: hypothetical protein QNJ22_06055 [Desulfosarcinaceae bacterium]|nr:hypothetical protein [Desulfosarcinaceae bacterium]
MDANRLCWHLGAILLGLGCLLAPGLAPAQHPIAPSGPAPDRLSSAAEAGEEPDVDTDTPDGLTFAAFGIPMRLNGFAEFNFEYLDIEDLEDARREDSSDFFISSIEAALRAFFTEWSKVKLVVSAEDLGKNGEEGRLIVSEAKMTLEAPGLPLYLIAGRTEMPFGVFEDHLIEGTLTEEIYEIDDLGVIIGFAPDIIGLDISLAIYETPAILDNLEAFDAFEAREGRADDPLYSATVVNVSAAPFEDLLEMALFYNNEPGDGRRNQSLGAALGISLGRLRGDAEWITALTREAGEDGQERRESAWVAGIAAAVTDAAELAARYEQFEDDASGDQDEILDHRWIVGGNLALSEWSIISVEYRYSRFEKAPDSTIEDQQQMVLLQLAFEY